VTKSDLEDTANSGIDLKYDNCGFPDNATYNDECKSCTHDDQDDGNAPKYNNYTCEIFHSFCGFFLWVTDGA
jgi:hypothetical protein